MRHRDWSLSDKSLSGLLEWLGDAGNGKKYEELRGRLIKFFEWRGCSAAEDCADIVIDRVAARVAEGAVKNESNPWLYCHGVARNVLREHWREPVRLELELGTIEAIEPTAKDAEDRAVCLEKCLEKLAPETRWVLIEYHQSTGGEKIRGRLKIADTLGIPLNALRIRLHRLRGQLQSCVENCLKREMK